jgi:hypothetical protein
MVAGPSANSFMPEPQVKQLVGMEVIVHEVRLHKSFLMQPATSHAVRSVRYERQAPQGLGSTHRPQAAAQT